MPGYGGAGHATLIRENQQVFLFQQENATGLASIALQPERNRSLFPWGISFQLSFTDANGNPSNPGTFEVDIQTSDIDSDPQYCPVSSWPTTSGPLNANFVGRIELISFYSRFIRVFVKTLTNAVFTTVLVTH